MFDKLGRVSTISRAEKRKYIHDWMHDGSFRAARDYAYENKLDNEGFSDVLAAYDTAHDLEQVGYLVAAVVAVVVPVVVTVKVVKRFKRK